MAYEVTITHLTGSRRTEVQTFTTLPLVLGRAEDADVQFDPDVDRKVSVRHAELRRGAEGVDLHDLGSTNGVFVDGARVDGRCALASDVTIDVGHGGPRLRVQWEESSGVSFGELRMKTDKVGRPAAGKPMATTDQALPVYDRAALEGTERRGAGAYAVVGVVLLVAAALVALSLLFA